MASVTIIIHDMQDEDDGTEAISIEVQSDPAFNMQDTEEHTPAQAAAMFAMENLHAWLQQEAKADIKVEVPEQQEMD